MSYHCDQCGYNSEPHVYTWPSTRFSCSICGMEKHYYVIDSEKRQEIQALADQKVKKLNNQIRKKNEKMERIYKLSFNQKLCADVSQYIASFNAQPLICKK